MFKNNVGGNNPAFTAKDSHCFALSHNLHLKAIICLWNYGKIKSGSASCCLPSIEGFETVNDAMIQSV